MEKINKFGADDLEGFEIVDHVGMDHGAHFNLVVLGFNEVLVIREVDQVRALSPQRTASDHARSSRTGAAEESLVQATEEATSQIS